MYLLCSGRDGGEGGGTGDIRGGCCCCLRFSRADIGVDVA